MTIIGISMVFSTKVEAEEFSFYEGDYIDGIYMTKEKNGTKYYQKARFFMLGGHNQFAYCIEPFAMFNENGSYQRRLTVDYLSNGQMDRIRKIAYFGYAYGSHLDPKWYAVAQLMIWREADPSGDIYFTDGLNGNRINAYEAEMAEINTLIRSYETTPSFQGTTYDLVEGNTLQITDQNQVLSHYQIEDNEHLSKDGNTLTIHDLEEGDYTFQLTRKDVRTTCIPFFYQSGTSQDMTVVGDLSPITISFKVHVQNTSINITKIDHDTGTTEASGEAHLDGAIYSIYDSNMELIDDITISEDMTGDFQNLDYGKYYIQEKEAGLGYELDTEVYPFEITREQPHVNLTLENKVIKKKIEISKKFGDGNLSSYESGISFDVFNSMGDVISTITTDQNGYASIVLPYGHYTLRQVNTTDGYELLDDILIDVEDSEDQLLELYDYKIKVPNTRTDYNYSIFLLFVLFGTFYVKKMFFC